MASLVARARTPLCELGRQLSVCGVKGSFPLLATPSQPVLSAPHQARHQHSNSRRAPQPDHYSVLGVKRDATSGEIRAAFLKKCKEHHPDVNESKKSHGNFVRINEAYGILGKPSSRRTYDLMTRGKSSQQCPSGKTHNWSDNFDYNQNHPGRRQTSQKYYDENGYHPYYSSSYSAYPDTHRKYSRKPLTETEFAFRVVSQNVVLLLIFLCGFLLYDF